MLTTVVGNLYETTWRIKLKKCKQKQAKATERIEAMIKGFPCSQAHYKGEGLEPITEMSLTASKADLGAYLKLTAYVYIKRAGKKQGESIYKEIGKIATYFDWFERHTWCTNLGGIKVPEVMHINSALELFGFDALTYEESDFIVELQAKYNN